MTCASWLEFPIVFKILFEQFQQRVGFPITHLSAGRKRRGINMTFAR